NTQQSRLRVHTQLRPGQARKRRRRQTALEHLENLEPRIMMAVLPPVTHSPQALNPINVSGGSGSANMSAPKVAVDPANPQKLVAAWVDLDPGNLGPPTIQSVIRAAYSTNGGVTWNTFNVPGNINDPTTTAPVLPYSEAIEPSIAFDHQNHVYLL